VVFIIGANKGFVLAVAQILASKQSSIEAAVATIDRDLGYLDLLVNNAGIMFDNKPVNT
jgi:NAD(P)-dependent dehydrogenase (short-subunit alcohol dehydrogenase family)